MYPTPSIWELIFTIFICYTGLKGFECGIKEKSILRAIGYSLCIMFMTGVGTQIVVNIGLFILGMLLFTFSTGDAAVHVQKYNEFLYCCSIPLWLIFLKS